MKSSMKKNLIKLGVMLAATFALTNCTEEITNVPTPEVAKNPYTIYANAPETKTVNDGFATKWAEKDSLNVAHAPAGTMDLSWNTRFDLADAASGRFETDNLQGELVVSNDWYVLYPYSEYVEYLSDTQASNAWFPVGSKASGVQTQKGNNSMAHIAGPDYPMYGIVKDSYSEEFPSLMMSHLSSLVEVKVTNNAGEPASVNSIIFTAPEDVVGTYFIDITSEVPTFTPSGENYVSNIAILTVKDGEPIAAGESASFYFAIKPFTAPAGSELTIDVNGTKKSINVEYDVTFSSGKIKTINFDYDEIIEPKESIQEGTYWITAELDGAEYYANAHAEGTNYGYLKADSEGFIDNAFTFTAVRGGGFTIQQADGRYLYLTGSYNNFNVSKELPAEGAVWNAYINDDGTHSIVNVDKLKTIYYCYNPKYNNYAAYTTQRDETILPVLVSAEGASERPVLTISHSSASIEADQTSFEFSIESNLSWTITADNDADVDPSYGDGDAVVTVSFPANSETSPVTYTVTVTSELGDKVLKITQAAVEVAGEVVDVLNNALTGVSGTTYKDWEGKTSNSDAVYAGQSAGDHSSIQLRSKNNNSGIVTTATGGYATKVSVVWNSSTISGRTLQIYGSSEPYSSPTELYNNATQGELLGEIVCGSSTELVISGAYSYIGMKSNSGAMYLDEVRVTWSDSWSDEQPENPGEVTEATVEDILAAEVDANVWYQVTGVVRGIYNKDYGNFYLEGDSGEQILVFGLTATQVEKNDKSFASLGIQNGDVLTLVGTRSEYKGTPQIGGPAYYISHEAGEEESEPDSEFEGDGLSAETAYTVADAKAYFDAGMDKTTYVWVKGAIIGSYVNNKLLEGTDGATDTNLAIGTPESHLTVQLPKDVRTALNLVDNPGNYEAEVAIYGTIEAYFSVAGVKNVKEYKFL